MQLQRRSRWLLAGIVSICAGFPVPAQTATSKDSLPGNHAPPVKDATPPKLAITSPGALVIGPPAIGVTLTFSDPESGFSAGSLAVKLDGTSITAACAATGSGAACPATVAAEGGHVLEAEVRNEAGLRTTARLEFQRRATPDTTAPSITILKPGAGATVDTVQPEIRIRYTDVGSAVDPGTLKVRVDGNLLDYCQAGRELARCPGPRLLPGTFLLTAGIADLAGNSAMATSSFDVPETRGDRTPPQLRLSNPTTAKVYTESTCALSFDLEDDFSGIDPGTIRIHYDGETITSSGEVSSSAAICLLPAIVGLHEGSASIADRAGNSASLAFELEIAAPASDTQAPEIILCSGGEPLQGKIFDSSDFNAEIHYLEQGVGLDTAALKVEIDGRAISCDGPVAGKTSECQEGSLSGGQHVLRAEAADENGNTSVASASFTMPNPPAPRAAGDIDCRAPTSR